MNKITYEGTKYSESLSKGSSDVRVVILSEQPNGNTAGLALLFVKELITFLKCKKPDVISIRLEETETSFIFSKDSSDAYNEEQLYFYTAVSQALQDYLNIYLAKVSVSAELYKMYTNSLIVVCEQFLKTVITLGGIFDYE